jgi:hypothetical protein
MVKTRSGKLSVPGKTVAGKPGGLVLSVAETAVVLRMSTQAAYDAIARNQIPHVRIGGMIKVPWIRLERMLNGKINGQRRPEPQITGPMGARAPLLPPKAKPVSLRRNPHVAGACENENWLDHLCDGRGKNCRGRDPMEIPLEILKAAGHPPRRSRELVSAWHRGDGGDCIVWERDVTEYADIRRHVCLPCVDYDVDELKRCTTINCPFWIYRTGHNPHHPRRGVKPGGK